MIGIEYPTPERNNHSIRYNLNFLNFFIFCFASLKRKISILSLLNFHFLLSYLYSIHIHTSVTLIVKCINFELYFLRLLIRLARGNKRMVFGLT